MRIFILIIVALFGGAPVIADAIDTSGGTVTVDKIVGGLDEPWGLAFLPGGKFLITQRGGQLFAGSPEGGLNPVAGTPAAQAGGQGGLLDVMVPKDYPQTSEIFLSFTKKQGRGSGTALAVATLSNDALRLTNLRIIFEMSHGSSGNRHFGGRIVEGLDGTIFLTIGDRGDRDTAQDRTRHNGSVIRINRDGSVPNDNPFVGKSDMQPEIWSYGHRNPQGATLDLQGNLWVNEHGARGGDEINRIRKGANFGWPIISYGRHYSGAKIGEGTSKPGIEQPKLFWDPSIAPSGMMIYSGKLWPTWRGNVFSGSLKFDFLSRVDPNNGWTEEKLQNHETIRVRDVREAPDGSIWYLSVGRGAVYRMSPG